MHNDLINSLHKCEVLVVDLETTGLDWYGEAKIAGIAIYAPEIDVKVYLPFRHGDPEQSYEDQGNIPLSKMPFLYDLLADPNKSYFTWNGKFDMLFLQHEGFPLLERGIVYHDVMTALHLLDENRRRKGLNYKLKDAARQFLGKEYGEAEDELKNELAKIGKKKASMAELPWQMVERYAVTDVEITWLLWVFFAPYLIQWQQEQLFLENSVFMSTVLLRMEFEGAYIDRDLARSHINASLSEAEKLEAEIKQLAPGIVNINSPAQVSAALRLPNAQRETLEESDNPIAKMIVDYKFLTKAENTFYRPYLKLSEYDSRLHPSFNIIGTVSGRLSSSGPNLQQVPRESTRYRIKEIFVAPPGYVFAQYDYSQMELRLAAHYAKEQDMIDAFNAGLDPHQFLADQLGVSRQVGKTLNFAILYGAGAEKVALKLEVSEKEAQELLNELHARYPNFKAAHRSIMKTAKMYRDPNGNENPRGYQYIRLMDGRVRHIKDDHDIFATWNTLIQGTGHILLRRSLIDISKKYPYNDRRFIPIITVHDSLIAYVDEVFAETISKDIVGIMTDFPEFNPRMAVDYEIGKSWAFKGQ